MKPKIKKIGFVSIEVVIVAALILGVGLAGVGMLSTNGRQLMQNGIDKLIWFDDESNNGEDSGGEYKIPKNPIIDYDDRGYPGDSNVNPGDINNEADFVFV